MNSLGLFCILPIARIHLANFGNVVSATEYDQVYDKMSPVLVTEQRVQIISSNRFVNFLEAFICSGRQYSLDRLRESR